MAEAAIDPRTLLVLVAHPDDETFGCGALIASAARSGVRVVVCCASRGERGEDISGRYVLPDLLGAAREAELTAAAAILGVDRVEVLGLADSGWDGDPEPGSIAAEGARLESAIADVINRYRPQVVVTLDPTGSDGHRDHAAVGRAATAAFERVADRPATLYHWCLPHSLMTAWAREIAERNPESVYLETDLGRPDDEVTTILDGADALDQVWQAIGQHVTQASPYDGIGAELAEGFVRYDHLVRVYPPWTGGPIETALRWPGAVG